MSYQDHLETPVGKMQITANQQAVTSIYFVDKTDAVNPNGITARAKQQLQEYFDGERQQFDLPLQARGTKFQQQVWDALCSIEYGQTCSYSDIAVMIENPKAVRAVGAANGKNPLTIGVPCHRIIGRDGSLTGYASGTQRKSWLLNHEGDSLF